MLGALLLSLALAAPAQDVIADVRVHGNHITPDAEVIAIAGVVRGAPFEADTVAVVTGRLKQSGRFQDVSVLKRFASIEDPTQIVVVLIVNEGPVRIEIPDNPGDPVQIVRRRGFRNLMFMPILDGEDGYGFTAGVRVAYVGGWSDRTRLSFPLTFGGTDRAGVELEHNFRQGPLDRAVIGGDLQSQRNPGFDLDDNRRRVWALAERGLGPVRLGVDTAWDHVTFGATTDSFTTAGGHVAFDTRLDPVLPRNAVYVLAAVDRVFFESGGSVTRTRVDARGYLGVVGQTVLVARVQRRTADAPLPDYLAYLLGGWSSLRGFEAGTFIGDSMAAGSLELRIPLNQVRNLAKVGVSVFMDAGKAWAHGQRFADVPLERGAGASVWFTVAAFRLSVGVAHGFGASTRVGFGGGLTF